MELDMKIKQNLKETRFFYVSTYLGYLLQKKLTEV